MTTILLKVTLNNINLTPLLNLHIVTKIVIGTENKIRHFANFWRYAAILRGILTLIFFSIVWSLRAWTINLLFIMSVLSENWIQGLAFSVD